MRRYILLCCLLAACFTLSQAIAQTSASAVPSLIRFSGALHVQNQDLGPHTVGLSFAIYREQEGGAPLWLETQNVTPDANGRYTVLLGNATKGGLPADLFASDEERWLGIRVAGQEEQARVLLVSVPYALKAREAETLGGLPASAFVKADSQQASNGNSTSSENSQSGNNQSAASQQNGVRLGPLTQGHGTKGYVPMWMNQLYLGNSGVFQDNSGNVGIATTSPAATLDVNGFINAAKSYQIGSQAVLSVGALADNNLFAGAGTGAADVPGKGKLNTFVGAAAGIKNTNGFSNTYLGSSAGASSAGASYNTFVGAEAGYNNTSGFEDTFIGSRAGYNNTSGKNNAFFGEYAGISNTTGSLNTFLGQGAGYFNTTGSSNLYVYSSGCGLNCNESNTIRIGTPGSADGQQNSTYIAGISGAATSSGVPVFIDSSGKLGTTGGSLSNLVSSWNGRAGAVVPQSGDYSFALLSGTLQDAQLGGTYSNPVTLSNDHNVLAGNGAGLSSVNAATLAGNLPNAFAAAAGSGNYIWNSSSLQDASFNVSGNGTLAGTLSALKVNSARNYQIGSNPVVSLGALLDEHNLFLGVGAGVNNVSGQGVENLFSGYQAGYFNTTGFFNVFAGSNAGYTNTTGSYNTFTGYGAGYSTTTGWHNVFTGTQAGYLNTTGENNLFAGTQAGEFSTTGSNNVFLGYAAGSSNSTGQHNVFTGSVAGGFNISGGYNVANGSWAGANLSTGHDNTFVGFQAGVAVKTGSNNIAIGSNAGPQLDEQNTIRIGIQGMQSATYIAGIYGRTAPGGLPVFANSDGLLGVIVSSRRFKQDIQSMGSTTDKLFQLRPVTFFYKPEYDGGSHELQYGLIAEEVAQVYPELVAYDKDGQPFTVKYQYLTPMLLNELQKQHAIVTSQQELISSQQDELKRLRSELDQQRQIFEQRLSRLEAHAATTH